jgi:hypothetical protein
LFFLSADRTLSCLENTAAVIELMTRQIAILHLTVFTFRRTGRPNRSELGRQIFAASVAQTEVTKQIADESI